MSDVTLDDDRLFALVHVPAAARTAVEALWRLDQQLGRIVATTKTALVGQMRLTWWHEALSSLAGPLPPRGEPVLDALRRDALPAGLAPAALAALVEGWEALLEPLPLTAEPLLDHATKRGAALFALTARLLGDSRSSGAAGEGWALVDFALRCSDPTTVEAAMTLARPRLERIALPRPLSILARLAAADAVAGLRVSRTRWRLFRAAL